MSSIAYITDSSMIDYHRLKGSKTMVFWRLGLKKFNRFNPGDLIFFIDRRHRYPDTQEKGVIGFARCTEIGNMPLKKAWDLHGQALGYNSESSFKDAIRYYRKEETLPARIQCIALEKVYFFQYPVFLSEVGFDLSERLESFTYLEANQKDIAPKILKIAENLGIDAWFQMQSSEATQLYIQQAFVEQGVRRVIAELPSCLSNRDANLLKKHTVGVLHEGIFYNISKGKIVLNYVYHNDINAVYQWYAMQEYVARIITTCEISTRIFMKQETETIQRLARVLNLELVSI